MNHWSKTSDSENSSKVKVDELTSKFAKMEEELKAALQDAAKWKDDYLRMAAEFKNYKNRSEIDLQQRLKFATVPLVKGLVDCLDDLELAIKHITDAEDEKMQNKAETAKGLKMAYDKFMVMLGNNNVSKIEAAGEKFDPQFA